MGCLTGGLQGIKIEDILRTPFKISQDIVYGHARRALVRLCGLPCQVRRKHGVGRIENRVIAIYWMGIAEVESGTSKPAFSERLRDGLTVHDSCP